MFSTVGPISTCCKKHPGEWDIPPPQLSNLRETLHKSFFNTENTENSNLYKSWHNTFFSEVLVCLNKCLYPPTRVDHDKLKVMIFLFICKKEHCSGDQCGP